MEDVSYLAKIKSYIRRNLKKGYTKESLKWALVDQGHSKRQIDMAFEKVEAEMAKEAPVLKTKPSITYHTYDEQGQEYKKDIRKKTFWRRIFD